VTSRVTKQDAGPLPSAPLGAIHICPMPRPLAHSGRMASGRSKRAACLVDIVSIGWGGKGR
jgi:hypothetical protein